MQTGLYQIISSTFCALVVISNVISAKMVSIPFLSDLAIPAGMITYPLTFLLSDLTTEIFGARKAKLMVYVTFGVTILCYFVIQLALFLPAADFENQRAFQTTLGLNGLIIFASLTAYLIAQIVDIQLYAKIKQWTGENLLWLRNNGSTLVSQIADTVAVNGIHLYWGLGMELDAVIQAMLFSYAYKAFFSIVNTPLFYGCLFLTRKSKKILKESN